MPVPLKSQWLAVGAVRRHTDKEQPYIKQGFQRACRSSRQERPRTRRQGPQTPTSPVPETFPHRDSRSTQLSVTATQVNYTEDHFYAFVFISGAGGRDGESLLPAVKSNPAAAVGTQVPTLSGEQPADLLFFTAITRLYPPAQLRDPNCHKCVVTWPFDLELMKILIFAPPFRCFTMVWPTTYTPLQLFILKKRKKALHLNAEMNEEWLSVKNIWDPYHQNTRWQRYACKETQKFCLVN